MTKTFVAQANGDPGVDLNWVWWVAITVEDTVTKSDIEAFTAELQRADYLDDENAIGATEEELDDEDYYPMFVFNEDESAERLYRWYLSKGLPVVSVAPAKLAWIV